MAVLTWRNVDAPSFRDSADGIRVAGAMFDRAAGNLSQGLGQFQDWRQNQTAGALLNNAQGYTDPEELRKAIASGAVFNGMDRSLVTPQALAALNAQSGTLLDQGVTAEGLRFAKQVAPYKIDNARLTNEGLDIKNTHDLRMSPLLQDQTIAGTANTRATTAQTLQTTDQNRQLFPLKYRGAELDNDSKKANIDQTIQTTQFRENLHPIDVANQKLKLREGEFDFGEKVTGVTNNNAATAFSMEAVIGSMTPQDVPYFLASDRFKAMNPNAQAIALGILQKRYPGVDLLSSANVSSAPPMTGGASTGTSSQAPVTAPVPTGSAPAGAVNNLTGYTPSAFVNSLPFDETRKYVPSILSKTGDLSGLSIYEKAKRIMPHLISTESSNDPNAVNKKTANDQPTGLTQIKPSTFAEMKKNYGIEGSITDRKSNVKAGEMYLKELLTKYDGDPEKALAAYNMGMGNLKTHLDKTGNTKPTSTSDESNPATAEAMLTNQVGRSTLAAEFALKGLGERIAQNNTSLTKKAETSLYDDKTDMMGAVDRLKKNQFYAGTPLAILKASIEKLTSMKGKDGREYINAAVAADILEESVNAPNKFERNSFGLLNYSTPDDAVAAEKAKLYLQGDMGDAVQRNIVTKKVSEKITAAKDNLEKASAEYSAALKRRPALSDEVIARYRGQVAWANRALDGVLELQNGDSNQPPDATINAYRPFRSTPAGVPVPLRVPPPNVRWRGTIPKIPVE